jgi:hypothetical protein
MKYNSNYLGLYDIDYYLNYNKAVTDTNELKAIVDKFIVIIKKRKFIRTGHFANYSIIMQNDSVGYLSMKTSGYRDFAVHFDFNLNRGQMHYITTSGF